MEEQEQVEVVNLYEDISEKQAYVYAITDEHGHVKFGMTTL